MGAKAAGKRFETEIEKMFLDITGQTLHDDIRSRTHRIRNSGGDDSDKGDIITYVSSFEKQLLIECKRRGTINKKDGPFINLPMYWFPKIREEAYNRGCLAVLCISFTGRKNDRIFAIVPEDTVNMLGLKHTKLDIVETSIVTDVKEPYTRLTQTNAKGKLGQLIQVDDCMDWFIFPISDFFERIKATHTAYSGSKKDILIPKYEKLLLDGKIVLDEQGNQIFTDVTDAHNIHKVYKRL